MSRVALPAGLAVTLLLAGAALAGNPTPPAQARLDNLHGFAASGDFHGSCEAAGYRFNTENPDQLMFHANAARLVIHRTWKNTTETIAPEIHPAITELKDQYMRSLERRESTAELGGGPIMLSWSKDAQLALHRSLDGVDGTLTARLEGTAWQATPADTLLRGGPRWYWYTAEQGGPGLRSDIIVGPARWLHMDQAVTELTGSGSLRTDGTVIETARERVELPVYEQVSTAETAPGIFERSILYTHAVIVADGLHLEVGPAAGTLACGAMEWAGTGAITFRRATGLLLHGEAATPFQEKEFSVNGEVIARETIEGDGRPFAQATLTGDFRAGLDYVQLESRQNRLAALAAGAGAMAALGAVAWAVWKSLPSLAAFFTRVRAERALDHPVRTLLHQFATEHPGATLADIVRLTGHSYSTVTHHARLLARLEQLSLIRFSREVHLFPARTAPAVARRTISLRNEPVRHLVQLLARGHRSLREVRADLIREFGRSPSWATRIVNEAERSGLVRREKTARGVQLSVAE